MDGVEPTADRRVLSGHAPVEAAWFEEESGASGYIYWVTGTDHLVHQPTLWAEDQGADRGPDDPVRSDT